MLEEHVSFMNITLVNGENHNFLENVRKKQENPIQALCLLIVIGQVPDSSNYSVDDLGNFPSEDTYRLIEIPENDPFDVSKNVHQTTEAHEVSEIFASYPFLYTNQHHQQVKGSAKMEGTFLRSKATDGGKIFVENLLGTFSAKKKINHDEL